MNRTKFWLPLLSLLLVAIFYIGRADRQRAGKHARPRRRAADFAR